MSPRRSSRARLANHPLSSNTQNSSSSSLSSGRERRSQRQPGGSPTHATARSQSLDDPDEIKAPPRRTRSGHDGVKEPTEVADPEPDPDAEDEEEEVTRCVCGQVEYPGLPTPIQDEEKQRAKQGGAATPDELPDDGSGIFIQCDICKVWQHGGCVGILDDDSAPEEYFCEQCRKDLHRVSTTTTGQKFSRYKPVREDSSPHRTPPQQTTRESARKVAKDSKPRASAEALIAKRRPTINSYDEQEQLRLAIEESKKDGIIVGEKKRNKRSRDASEEEESPSKRPRTGSNSIFTEPEKSNNALSSSDEALIDLKPDGKVRSSRFRDKEIKDQKERERADREPVERSEHASTKRRVRSDRRRGLSESDTMPAELDATTASTRSSPPAPSSPKATITAISRHPKKNGITPASSSKLPKSRRGDGPGSTSRPGIASSLRERADRGDRPPSALQHALDPKRGLDSGGMRTRSRSRSRAPDSPKAGDHGSGTGGGSGGGLNGTVHQNGNSGMNGHHNTTNGSAPSPFSTDGIVARPSRPKHMNPNRTSMNEMKKRVAGILEFVTKAQEELARRRVTSGESKLSGATITNGAAMLVSTPTPVPAAANGSARKRGIRGEKEKEKASADAEALTTIKVEDTVSATDARTVSANGSGAASVVGGGNSYEEFAALQTAEMMRVLRERLVGWESEYGRWGKAPS